MPTSEEALLAKYPVAVSGQVINVKLEPGAIDSWGLQSGKMTVTILVSAVQKGPPAVGQSLTFTGSTVLLSGNLDGPISAIPSTLKVGDRVHAHLDRQDDGLIVPYWAALRPVE